MFTQVAAMGPFLSTGFFTPLSEGGTQSFASAPSRLAYENCSFGRLCPSDACRRLQVPAVERNFMVSMKAAQHVRLRGILTVLLCGISVRGGIELWMEWPDKPGLFHVAFETAVFTSALAGVAHLWTGWMRTLRSLTRTVEVSDRLRRSSLLMVTSRSAVDERLATVQKER